MASFGLTDVSVFNVAVALKSPSTDIGTLCTSNNINIWSKWKPIFSYVDTMSLNELYYRKFGLTIIHANTPKLLVDAINKNNELGFQYIKPTKYRLGDFRLYNPQATIPCEKTYLDEEEINIGGVTDSNHGSYERDCGGIETMSTNTTIGADDLYFYYDKNGEKKLLHRGFYITDGTNNEWYSGKFYWWTTTMQKFANMDVTIYEFYTNAIKTPDTPYIQNANDVFYAIPYPKYTKHIKSETPSGSRIVATMLHAQFLDEFDNPTKYEKISYNVYFDATDKIYRGGTINNVWIKLCRDKKGKDVIEQVKLAESITIDKDTRSKSFLGILTNRPKDLHSELSPDVWVIVWWNQLIQAQLIPMMTKPDIQ